MERPRPRYKTGKLIGRRGIGLVYKCRDTRDNSKCVMKVIPFVSKEKGVSSSVIREISVLRELSHDNVVRLLDVYDDAEGFHLIFEPLELNLTMLIYGPSKKELKPAVIKSFLFQILQAVSYCHSQKVMHRDLKPDNFLINMKSKTIKLADFGWNRTFDVPRPLYTNDVMPLTYRAPEVLLWEAYTRAVDVWSVGCIFAEMVEKNVLFGGNSDRTMMDSIINVLGLAGVQDWRTFESSIEMLYGRTPGFLPPSGLQVKVPNLDPQGYDLLSKMLCWNPEERITAFDALKHPYFEDLQ